MELKLLNYPFSRELESRMTNLVWLIIVAHDTQVYSQPVSKKHIS
jgi:hypothetical protein